MDNIRGEMMQAVDRVMTCEPDYLVMGMSSETFWDGLEGSSGCSERVEQRAGVKVCMGSDASQAALKRYGAKRARRDHALHAGRRRAGAALLRPIAASRSSSSRACKCKSPVLIAHVSERELRDAIIEVNGPDVDAIIQVGTNLAMARLAGIAEFWLDKPVLAINTCIYWWALRQNGINDKIDGFGSLLSQSTDRISKTASGMTGEDPVTSARSSASPAAGSRSSM